MTFVLLAARVRLSINLNKSRAICSKGRLRIDPDWIRNSWKDWGCCLFVFFLCFIWGRISSSWRQEFGSEVKKEEFFGICMGWPGGFHLDFSCCCCCSLPQIPLSCGCLGISFSQRGFVLWDSGRFGSPCSPKGPFLGKSCGYLGIPVLPRVFFWENTMDIWESLFSQGSHFG